MNLDLLKTFVIFAKSKNIVEAARTLQVSQPTVSVQLHRLEQDFRDPLFSLEGKKKVLTPFGRALFEEMDPLFERIENSIEQIEKRFSDPSQLLLKVGARAEILSRIISGIQFPGAIQFIPLRSQDAVDRLLSHEIDVAIVASQLRPDLAHLHSRKLFSDRVQWICHSKWLKKLSSQEASGSLKFLKETPFLAYKKNAPFLSEWLSHLGEGPMTIRPHRICEDWNAILKLVEEGLGYSLVPSGIVSQNPELKSCMLPSEVLPEMTFYALYHFDLMKIPAIEKTLKFGV